MQASPLELAGEVAGPCLGEIRDVAQVPPDIGLGVCDQLRGLGGNRVAMIALGIERGLRNDRAGARLLEDQPGAILLMPDEMDATVLDNVDGGDGVAEMEQALPLSHRDHPGRNGAQVIFHRGQHDRNHVCG